MDVRNSMKFGINSGNVYCQCYLNSKKKDANKKKKKESEYESSMIEKKHEYGRESVKGDHPP